VFLITSFIKKTLLLLSKLNKGPFALSGTESTDPGHMDFRISSNEIHLQLKRCIKDCSIMFIVMILDTELSRLNYTRTVCMMVIKICDNR
jgi:hypothetical protein